MKFMGRIFIFMNENFIFKQENFIFMHHAWNFHATIVSYMAVFCAGIFPENYAVSTHGNQNGVCERNKTLAFDSEFR